MNPPEGLRGLVAAVGASLAALSLALSPVAARDATAQVDAPALWRVDDPKGRVFLFGSFHLLPVDVKWRTAAVESALKEAAVVIFETDFAELQASQALLARYGRLPPGQTLRSVLPRGIHAELEKTAVEIGVPPPSLEPLRAWVAALNLGMQLIVSQGFDPNLGVEKQIRSWA